MSGARLQVFGRGGEQRHTETVAPFIGIEKTLPGDLASQRGIAATALNPDKTRWWPRDGGLMFQDSNKSQIICLVEHLSSNQVGALCVKPILALPKLFGEPYSKEETNEKSRLQNA